LENVKPEDTKRAKALNKPPEEQQIGEDMEIIARENLVKAVRQKVLDLPAKILPSARDQAKQNNLEAAAEEYILNAAAVDAPSRDEAPDFYRSGSISLATSPSSLAELRYMKPAAPSIRTPRCNSALLTNIICCSSVFLAIHPSSLIAS
jgi:hypothetical protein